MRSGRRCPPPAGRAPSSSTPSPTWSAATPNGPPPRPTRWPPVGGLLAYLDAAAVVENGLAPAQIVGRAEPGAGADRARREGSGMAGGGRAPPVGRIVPVDGVGSHLAHRRRRPSAAAARRSRRDGRARRAGSGHLGCDRSKAAVGQDLRASSPARATPRRRGAQAAVRGHHPRRGHPAAVRPPLGRHRDQAARAVGFPVRAQGHHRPVGRGRRAVRGGRAVGARAGGRRPKPVARQRSSRRSGPSTRWAARRADVRARGGAGRRCDVGRRTCTDAPTPTPKAGRPTSTRCSTSAPASRARRHARCPASCRSAAWWTWPAIPSTPRSG